MDAQPGDLQAIAKMVLEEFLKLFPRRHAVIESEMPVPPTADPTLVERFVVLRRFARGRDGVLFVSEHGVVATGLFYSSPGLCLASSPRLALLVPEPACMSYIPDRHAFAAHRLGRYVAYLVDESDVPRSLSRLIASMGPTTTTLPS